MTAGFGGSPYTNPQARTLNSIANSGEPDTTSQEKMVELLQKHSAQLRYLAANQKQMQQGINDAAANPIQQIQQFAADITVLLGGGELANGALDFGDLQYILPALGAMFGLGDGPFPISLFEAAQKFFLGYVVPQQQFVDVINSIITAWADMFGIDPQFVADVRKLLEAFGNLFDGLNNVFPSLNQLFTALGISGADLGPLGQALAPIINLFSGIDLTKFGSFIEFITDAIGPFIVQLTAVINFVNGVLAVLGYDGGDVVNSPLPSLLQPFQNLVGFLANINFFGPDFDPLAAVRQFVNMMLLPLNLLLGPSSPINQWQLPPIGPGQIADTSAGAVSDGGFDAIPEGESGRWYRDAAVGRTDPGCLAIDGDGTEDELIGAPMGVAAGQKFRPSVWVSWSGAAGSTGSARLTLVEFANQTPVRTVVVASVTPSGTSSWVELADDYTVPPDVDMVALAPAVTAGFTAGTVRFDDVTRPSPTTGVWPMSWMGGLPDLNIQSNQIRDILAGLAVTPADSVIGQIKDWFSANQAANADASTAMSTSQSVLGAILSIGSGGTPGSADPDIVDALSKMPIGNIVDLPGTLQGLSAGLADLRSLVSNLRQATEVTLQDPQTIVFEMAGTEPYVVPSWMVAGDKLQLIALGGGCNAPFGLSGKAGLWAAAEVTIGDSGVVADATLSVTVGAGGEQSNQARPGGASAVTVGATTLVSGAGGPGSTVGVGQGAGEYVFDGITYYGGGTQIATGGAGLAPGGGGCGGPFGFFGGPGAPGMVAIRAVQA